MCKKFNFHLIVVLIIIVNWCNCEDEEKNYIYHYDRLDHVNGTGEYFDYSYEIQKKDGSDSVFIVTADIDQLIELDNNWKFEIIAYRADTKDGEYEHFMKFPRLGICTAMKSFYKRYFYDVIKDYSNLPHYDTCPLPVAKYNIKEYPMDGDNFKKYAVPGFFRIEAYLINEDVTKTGVHFFGSVEEK